MHLVIWPEQDSVAPRWVVTMAPIQVQYKMALLTAKMALLTALTVLWVIVLYLIALVEENRYASQERRWPATGPASEMTEPRRFNDTRLYLQLMPQHNVYLAGETTGTFVVSSRLSPWHGTKFNTTDETGSSPFLPEQLELIFTIALKSTDTPLVQNAIGVNTTYAYEFDLAGLTPSPDPIEVEIYSNSLFGGPYIAKSSFYYLPEHKNGSVVKIDNLNGGILVEASNQTGSFEHFLSIRSENKPERIKHCFRRIPKLKE